LLQVQQKEMRGFNVRLYRVWNAEGATAPDNLKHRLRKEGGEGLPLLGWRANPLQAAKREGTG
jgi:hypothetical protein